MFDPLRDRVLRFMRVPHEPEPPAGAPGSIRVFRAGRNFYKLKLCGWAIGQVGALVGIIVSLAFLARIEREVEQYRESRRNLALLEAKQAAAAKAAEAAAKSTPAAPTSATGSTPASPVEAKAATPPSPEKSAAKAKGKRRDRANTGLGRIIDRSPWWVFPLLQFLEYAGIVVYLLQIPLTYAMVRLDWEQRWYIVTDRSLRIRTGLTTVLESTMSFANLQQVVVTQGPLQRALGLADVRVQSAGGGGSEHQHAGAEPSLHTGIFHGVEDAAQIRDLILERLRLFRQAGLGDPDDQQAGFEAAAGLIDQKPPADETLAAAAELLEEARALRLAVKKS